MYSIHLESDLTHFNRKILDSYMSRFAALLISVGISQIYNVEFLRYSNCLHNWHSNIIYTNE